ncbi:hypothetical protein ACJX0J_007271, partial [Zea mays]
SLIGLTTSNILHRPGHVNKNYSTSGIPNTCMLYRIALEESFDITPITFACHWLDSIYQYKNIIADYNTFIIQTAVAGSTPQEE